MHEYEAKITTREPARNPIAINTVNRTRRKGEKWREDGATVAPVAGQRN